MTYANTYVSKHGNIIRSMGRIKWHDINLVIAHKCQRNSTCGTQYTLADVHGLFDNLHPLGHLPLHAHRVVATPLAAPIITLTGFSGLTKLSISSPDITMSKADSQALGQLMALPELDLLYQPAEPLAYGSTAADMTPLARLINLERLRVQGLVPAVPEPAAAGGVAGGAAQLQAGEQQQQGGAAGQAQLQAPQQLCYCLPPNLTSLCFQGTRNERPTEPSMVQHWVLHAAGAPHIQQLHLNGFWVGEEFIDGSLKELDLSPLSGLTELRCVCAPEPGIEFCGQVELPPSLTALKDLEVLWMGTKNCPYPWDQHCWVADEDLLGQVSHNCKKLRKILHLVTCPPPADVPPAAVELDQLTSIYIIVSSVPPAWLTPRAVPQLQQLTVDCCKVTTGAATVLAQLTSLTSLRIDTGSMYVADMGGGLCGIEALGRALTGLQRLELGNHHGQSREDDEGLPAPLTLPDLSAFTQIKQMRLTCAVNLTRPMPQHPSAMEFLSCLQPLTQLEQLQVSGYTAVAAGLLGVLLGCLPRVTEVELASPLPRAVGAFCVWAAAGRASAGGTAAGAAAARAAAVLGEGVDWPPSVEVLRLLKELRPGITKLTLL